MHQEPKVPSVRLDVSRRIFAGFTPQDIFSFCVGCFGRIGCQSSRATYRVAPHGIGGAATHLRRRIVVGITIVVAITESGRRTRILENALIYPFVYPFVPSLLFSVFARQ
jgi:hypothetical protein